MKMRRRLAKKIVENPLRYSQGRFLKAATRLGLKTFSWKVPVAILINNDAKTVQRVAFDYPYASFEQLFLE